MQELDFSEILDQVMSFLQENIIPVLIVFVLILYVGYQRVKKNSDSRTSAIRTYWTSIQKNAYRLTTNFHATIGDMDESAFGFKGNLYQIDSETYDEVVEKESPIPITIEEVEKIRETEIDLPDNEKTHIVEKEEIVPITTEELKEIEEIPDGIEKTKRLMNRKEKQYFMYETYRVIEKRKSETALAMIPTNQGGQIIAIRRSGLRETETILSEVEEVPLIELDPEISKGHLKLIMIALIVYEALLMYFILTETEPTLLFSSSAWPWYVVLLLAWINQIRIDNEKKGRKVLYRGIRLAEESFPLKDKLGDEKLVLSIPVYEVVLHYHPAIPTKNLLKGVGKKELYNDTIKTLERRVTSLSAENVSLLSRLDQTKSIMSHKDAQLVSARNEHVDAFNDGFNAGYARYHISTPENEQPQFQQTQGGISGLDWFREAKLPIIVIMILVAGYFLLQGITEAISNASTSGGGMDLFSPNILLGLGLVVLVLLVGGRITRMN